MMGIGLSLIGKGCVAIVSNREKLAAYELGIVSSRSVLAAT
jgi:hypothetical protein